MIMVYVFVCLQVVFPSVRLKGTTCVAIYLVLTSNMLDHYCPLGRLISLWCTSWEHEDRDQAIWE